MAAGDTSTVTRQMQQLQVAPKVVLPGKIAPGTRGASKVQISSNIWSIHPQKNMPVYRYDVRIYEEYPKRKDTGEPGMKEVTKQTRADYLSIDRKNKCVVVYKRLLSKESKFFGNMTSFVYDRASILYSLNQLKIGSDETKAFSLLPTELPEDMRVEECVKIHCHIKQCTEDFQLSVHDLKFGVGTEPGQINRSVQQFYELLLSQEAFFTEGAFVSYGAGENYLLQPENFGFRPEPELPDGKYIGVGASKGVKIIEGTGNKGLTVGMIVDVKKAAFHIDFQPLHEKVGEILNVSGRLETVELNTVQKQTLQKMLKGLFVKCTHRNKAFMIAGLTQENAVQFKFAVENRMVTVSDYFRTKYNVQLKFAKLPLVREHSPKGDNFYPMECLIVCENQRVNLTQQSSKQVQAMIRACAIPPVFRVRQTNDMIRALNLDRSGGNNRWLREMQMTVSPSNVMSEARVLPLPRIEYGRQVNAQLKNNTSWIVAPNMQYILPVGCQKWYAIALTSGNDPFQKNHMDVYIREFVKRCRMRGMNMSEPLAVDFIARAKESEVELAFKKAKSMNATFIHFVTSEQLKYHVTMKFHESQLQILSQDLQSKNALTILQRPLTMDNIVHKTNLKLGGFNFVLHLDQRVDAWVGRKDRIIIGIDLAFSTVPKDSKKPRTPSVVGYSSNSLQHPLNFNGGYRYAYSRMEELDEGDTTITKIVKECLDGAKRNRNGSPTHIVILRDGISEGQYGYVFKQEVQQVKDACAALGGAGYRPHITFLVATKKHNMRLYRKDIPQGAKAPDQNIPPGTVVDKDIVNPKLTEFYLNSHSSFQGTAKTPRYNLVFDTSKMVADEMQALVHALTFNFQIVSQACSLPAPIMIADRMAQRGKANFLAKFGDSSSGNDQELDLDHLNNELCYAGKLLEAQRFNA